MVQRRVRGILGIIAVIIAVILWLLVLLGCSLGVILEEGRVSVNATLYVENPYTSTIPVSLNASLTTGRKPVFTVGVPLSLNASAEPAAASLRLKGAAVLEVSLPGGNAHLRLLGAASSSDLKHSLAEIMASNQEVMVRVEASTPLGPVSYSTTARLETRRYFSDMLSRITSEALHALEGAGAGVDGAYVRITSARLLGVRMEAANLEAYETIEVCVRAEPAPPVPVNATIHIDSVLVDQSTMHHVAYTVKPLTVQLSPSQSCGMMILGVPLENVSEAMLYAAWILGVQGEYNATLNTRVTVSVENLPAVSTVIRASRSHSRPS